MLLSCINSDYIIIYENIEKKKPYIIKALTDAGIEDQDNIVDYLVKADPVANKSGGKKTPFINLILKWLINNKIRLPEDIDTVSEILSKANDLVNNKGVKLDINNYDSPGDLRKDVNEKLGVVEKGTYDYLELVDQIPGFKLYKVNSWEEGERAFKDSGWCVQRKNHFDGYDLPYFMVVTSDDKRYALMHKDSNQIKDVHDNSLTIDKAIPIKKFILETWPKFVYSSDLISINDLWPGAINEIKKNPEWAYTYAHEVIKGKWPEGEEAIKQDPEWAYKYARYVIYDRWPEGEEIIKQDPGCAYHYAYQIIGGRWPEGEEAIKKEPESAYTYACYIIKDKWPEAEETIKKDPQWAYRYASNIIEGRWPEAEETIKQDPDYWSLYKAKFL